MNNKVKFILTIVIIVLAFFCGIMNIFDENYVMTAIWGAIAGINTVSAVLMLKKK